MRIYTIGHSNTPFENFLRNLRLHGIEILIDIRSSPYSKYAGHFNHDYLKTALEEKNISYMFMGDCLGGMPTKTEYYKPSGKPDYEKMARDPWFIEGIENALSIASRSEMCLMCSEEDPVKCHRSKLVSARLTELGAEILHIRGDGSTETEEENAERRFSAKDNQMDLFS